MSNPYVLRAWQVYIPASLMVTFCIFNNENLSLISILILSDSWIVSSFLNHVKNIGVEPEITLQLNSSNVFIIGSISVRRLLSFGASSIRNFEKLRKKLSN